jgi:outer membrane protein assembly factor BamB
MNRCRSAAHHILFALAALGLAPALPGTAQGNPGGVYTYHYDTMRTGWNRQETALSHATVNPTQFGKLWSRPVDGQVYAQPLYAPALNLGAAGTHNVVFVATEHNSVYAFDADTGGDSPLWQARLGPSVPVMQIVVRDSTDPNGDPRPCSDIEGPEYGITGTPVIDPATQTLYVVAKTLENIEQIYRLHALDIRTGQDRPGWPVRIRGSVAGSGGDNVGGQIAFDPFIQLQRPGLLLLNGRVVIGFGAHCDFKIHRYHGWIFSYNAADPTQPPLVYNSTPDASVGAYREAAGGIWQAGFGLTADEAGNIYFETGNGLFNADMGGRNVGNSVVRLTTAGGTLAFTPSPANFYTPNNERQLDQADLDLGSGAAMVVPDQTGTSTPRLLLTSGKDGVIRLLNRDFLGGHYGRPASDQRGRDDAIQKVAGIGGTWCGPAYWEGPDGSSIFYTGVQNRLRQFRLGTNPDGSGKSALLPIAQSAILFGYPSPTPVISSNGRTAGTGIVWVLRRDDNTLRAFSAENVATLLWHTLQAAGDALDGRVVKFSVPIVANGKVYVGTKSTLVCYGLR